MKLNKAFIKQLRNGEIAAENNGTLEQLREVLKEAFPKYHSPRGCFIFYSMDVVYTGEWVGNDKTTLPVKKISDFYEPELFTGWAKYDIYPKWMVYFKDDIALFGFNDGDDYSWMTGDRTYTYKYSEFEENRPATNEEIEKHLIQEAKRRGYKGGGTIKGIDGTTHSRPGNIWFRYHPEDDRLLTNVGCIVYEGGQWAEIVGQPEPQPKQKKSTSIHYLVDGMEYSFNYQELKAGYEDICQYSDEQFMEELPEIAHLACIISFFKGLGSSATIGYKGIVHELLHLMTEPDESTNNLQEVRRSFNEKIKLV